MISSDNRRPHKKRETVRPGAMIKKPWNIPEYVSIILSNLSTIIYSFNILAGVLLRFFLAEGQIYFHWKSLQIYFYMFLLVLDTSEGNKNVI